MFGITEMDEQRRRFLAQSAVAGGGLAALSLGQPLRGLANEASPAPVVPRGKAEHCIMIWLGGGSSHIDTWDPKRMGDAKTKKPGSYYPSIETAVPDTQVCEHLPKCAQILDRFNIVRTVHHDVIDEHAAATNQVHTGRPTSGTVVYPSVGSIVAHKRGPASEHAPGYVLIGYPNVTRGPGFLGAKAGYIYLTDTKSGPAGFSRAPHITAARQTRREDLLRRVRDEYRKQLPAGSVVSDYDTTISEALRLSGPKFANVFELDSESASLRESYGGEFGQRCLLSRRLLQSGVRFIEVSHNLNFVNGTGWDTHNDGQLKQHVLIQELDDALSALVLDLEQHKMLDKTLIVVASEFGRPAQFDGGGGRGHYSKAFSVVLAGGGMNNGKTIGVTDELAMKIESDPVSLPDLHATIHNAMGIDPHEELYTPDDRPVPITDNGRPIAALFS
ncbi:hypothetical protein Mal52_61650 [Symmachiella dynata]|uniref:Sulfatase n=1 Tax=Symmachiella dynata TaxID=2527995 RepID=A0A517ZYV9_9PLAN|nr:DUF1501 domain-containing protein [Symmachiella dynata]QDU47630.1 hypothetical protein Mal52_61650 [Symmachiella dynata]